MQFSCHRPHVEVHRVGLYESSLAAVTDVEGSVGRVGRGTLSAVQKAESKNHFWNELWNLNLLFRSTKEPILVVKCEGFWHKIIQPNSTEQIASAGFFFQMPSRRHHLTSDTMWPWTRYLTFWPLTFLMLHYRKLFWGWIMHCIKDGAEC